MCQEKERSQIIQKMRDITTDPTEVKNNRFH